MYRQAQPTPHEELDSFEVRVIVAGTRHYDDYEFFSRCIFAYLNTYLKRAGVSPLKSKIIFLSGKASTGADAMIIRWCQQWGWPWAEFPAEWDDVEVEGAVIRINRAGKPYNVRAGFTRNAKMGARGTHLLTFYDGQSNGTGDMIKLSTRLGLDVSTLLVDKSALPCTIF